jgi:PAS domain S-box-containing protein
VSNNFGLNRSLGGAILAIAVVAFLSSIFLLISLRQLDNATKARVRANEIIQELNNFRFAMLNQETGLRGYLLTGEEISLEPYNNGRSALDGIIGRLRTLIGADQRESAPLSEAVAAARTWQMNIAVAAIGEMADPGRRAEARRIESSLEGKTRFDELRAKLGSIEQQAQRDLEEQANDVRRADVNANVTLGISTLLTLLICAGIGIAVNRWIAEPLTQLADAMRRLTQRDLSVAIPGATHRNEVGEMARAVQVFKNGMIELDRTTLLRTTADTLPALVGYVDASRRIGFLNGEFARWFDLHVNDVSELQGKSLELAFHGGTFPGQQKELEAAFSGEETRFEHQLKRPDMGFRQVEAFYRPHRAPDGRVLGVVTLLTDITERKRMEDRLARQTRDLMRSNEELEQFAYVASHDLKAPLRGIENLVTWIEEDLQDHLGGDTRTNMDLLKSRVSRLENLLDDLLAYSRAGRGELSIESVDTGALINDLAALVSPPEGFSIECSSNLPILETAKAPLTQVLQNLIGNAIKHHDHPSDGHIWIDAKTLRYAIEFSVTDDGPGIPAQFRERVFGMFQTLRPRDEVEGSGMGLAIVKKLVERVGGRVWLEGRQDGRGLTIRFTWPKQIGEISDGADRQFAAG